MDRETFLYRIYTEGKNVDELMKIVGARFESFSARMGAGSWHGETESSIVFEVVTDQLSALSLCKHIADEIKEANDQAAVLVTRAPVESFLF